MKPKRIALFGPYASRNLGDTATQLAVMQNLRQRLPQVQLLGVSPEPDDTLRSLGLPTFPLSGHGPSAGDIGLTDRPATASERVRTTLRIGRFIRTLDMLIVSGGGQLDDFWGGPWAHPWSMLLWTALARWHRVPVVVLGIGLDHLNAALSQRFALTALRWAQLRVFRDEDSLRAMVAMGLKAASRVCPDLAFSLTCEAPAANEASAQFVVLSPISRKTWSHAPTEVHERYLERLAHTGAALAQRGLALRIACSQPAMDMSEAHTLLQQLSALGVRDAQLCSTPTVPDFLRALQGAQLVIASRLHAVILSLVAGCPVLALPHLPKVSTVMRDAGLGDYHLPLRDFSAADLTARAMHALTRVDTLRAHVRATHERWRVQVQEIFDDVLTLF